MPIQIIFIFNRILRLEFNHKLLPYYTELDAIMLKGRTRPHVLRENNNLHSSLFHHDTSPMVKQGMNYAPFTRLSNARRLNYLVSKWAYSFSRKYICFIYL